MNRHYLHFIASLRLLLVNSDIPTSHSMSSKTAVSSIRFSQQQQQQQPQTPHRHSLPLERYTKKQNQELATINEEIHLNQSELKEFDSKLRQAAKQNDRPLSACGNCHLKWDTLEEIALLAPADLPSLVAS